MPLEVDCVFIKFIKNNKIWLLILLFFIITPMLIQRHAWPIYEISLFLTPGSHESWMQFWGSYLGIVPSGLIAYLVAKTQLDEQKRRETKAIREQMYLDDLRKLYSYVVKWQDMDETLRSFSTIRQIAEEATMSKKELIPQLLKTYGDSSEKEIFIDSYRIQLETFSKTLPVPNSEEIRNITNDICEQTLNLGFNFNLLERSLIKDDVFQLDMEKQWDDFFKSCDKIIDLYSALNNEIVKEISKYNNIPSN